MTLQARKISEAPEEISFTLPYSGIACTMRRPKISDRRRVAADPLTKTEEDREIAVLSYITTFDGAKYMFHDLDCLDIEDLMCLQEKMQSLYEVKK